MILSKVVRALSRFGQIEPLIISVIGSRVEVVANDNENNREELTGFEFTAREVENKTIKDYQINPNFKITLL